MSAMRKLLWICTTVLFIVGVIAPPPPPRNMIPKKERFTEDDEFEIKHMIKLSYHHNVGVKPEKQILDGCAREAKERCKNWPREFENLSDCMAVFLEENDICSGVQQADDEACESELNTWGNGI